jgi:hypothetical protein
MFIFYLKNGPFFPSMYEKVVGSPVTENYVKKLLEFGGFRKKN